MHCNDIFLSPSLIWCDFIMDSAFLLCLAIFYSFAFSPFKVLKFNVATQDAEKLLEGRGLLIVPKQLFLWCLTGRGIGEYKEQISIWDQKAYLKAGSILDQYHCSPAQTSGRRLQI